MHAPDCALTIYGHLDEATLKQPLVCDCEESDGAGPTRDEADVDDVPHAIHARPGRGPSITLTGSAATTYKLLQTAEGALRSAQKRKDDALKAFLEAVTT